MHKDREFTNVLYNCYTINSAILYLVFRCFFFFSKAGSSGGNVTVVASVVVVLVLVIGVVLLLAITGAIWYRRKMQHTESLVKDHVYDHVKTLGLNGSNHEHIDADDNVIYTTAPSTIVGDRNSMLFDEVQLTERPTDQEGSI